MPYNLQAVYPRTSTKTWLGAALSAICLIVACGLPAELLSPEVAFKTEQPAMLRIGASAISITPQGAVFLAGGIPYRPSLNVHDDIWARAVVIDDGSHRVALVALDLIGLYYDDVVHIREEVAKLTDIDYLLIASTHTHNAPDMIGIWSPTPLPINDPYIWFLSQQVAAAVAGAASNLQPAHIRIASGTSGQPPLSRDTRKPEYIDDTLTVWQAMNSADDTVIATVVHYASHPILVPSFNFDISSDFPHYLREALESGATGDDGPVNGLGGVCLFFNGALGGRITPANAEPFTDTPQPDAVYARAQSYGYRLAHRAQELLAESELLDEPLGLSVNTRRLRVPVETPLLGLALNLSLLDRAAVDGQINTEVGIVGLGPIRFFAVPGMIFPELVRGDIAALPGSDFPDALPESPLLAELTEEPYLIVVGLANDMLGYIIPKALWDAVDPFTTDNNAAPYGELISAGPNTAGLIIDAFASLQAP